MQNDIKSVIDFWRDAGSEKWFIKNERFDNEIVNRFLNIWRSTSIGNCDIWNHNADGCLALLIVLDQFSRNMFRNSPIAFSNDRKTLAIAEEAVNKSYDQKIERDLRAFMYLPFEHSENIKDQKKSIQLFTKLGDKNFLEYAQIHYDIIEKFGRFPHRNKILGRISTAQEQDFLKEGGFAG